MEESPNLPLNNHAVPFNTKFTGNGSKKGNGSSNAYEYQPSGAQNK